MDNKKINGAAILSIALPILLLAPNIGLDYTERMSVWDKILNILTPLSVYMLIMSYWKRTGLVTLLMIPMMCFAGFQIVLLYLYGGSIIGVDMFLNVVTTNATEVGELLGNLLIAIGLILLLYLPPIIMGIVLTVRKTMLPENFRKSYRLKSVWFFCIMFDITLIASLFFSYRPATNLYPLNIFNNLVTAFVRTAQVNNYPGTSARFTYSPELPADSIRAEKEVYVMVVGETGRAGNWQLGGYERETNPRLSQTDNLVYFPYTLTESNTTHKSVPMLISPLTALNFNNITKIKSAVTLFKESGFETFFFSNQQRNRAYTEYFGEEADSTVYLSDLDIEKMDGQLVNLLKKQLADTSNNKKFFILHTYGSHFKYNDRYPENFGAFKPDNVADANKGMRPTLINAFDNTILYADSIIAEVINTVNKPGIKGAVIYTSDHGEDIFDDERARFLHASPVPTAHQLHVPMLVALTDFYVENYPEKIENLRQNSTRQVSSTASYFNTLVDLSGISTPYLNHKRSLASNEYSEPERYFLTDRNEPIKVTDSGITELDMEVFNKRNINPN